MGWMSYHIFEETLIAIIGVSIALRAFMVSRSGSLSQEVAGRVFLISSGFLILGVSSGAHAAIHTLHLNLNILYQTLLGYALGLLTIITAIASEKPEKNRYFPLLYLPLILLLHPKLYSVFPVFGEFRPLGWLVVSYFSGVLFMLYIAAYYRTRSVRYLYSSFGHALICTGAIMLFFPAAIGSRPWIYGHLLRPLGFIILFFSMKRENMRRLSGSILYKALTAFSLLAAIPLLVYGAVIFYENISTISIVGRKIIVFILLLSTLASALIFALGLIIRLIRPLLQLKDSVSGLVEKGLNEKIEIRSNDEIGELSDSYNEMVLKLRQSIAERDRLSRLAATGELSATLAHEIKNPLNAISMAATYLRGNYRGKLINEFVRIIQAEAARINKLTTNLLNFAKPQNPEFALSDINTLVEETAALLKQESREQDITIRIEKGADIPLCNFDYNQIKQVLLNLVINAFDAVDRSGTVEIRTRSDNGTVLLSVEDDGRGISEEDMNNIFNPFFTTKTRGTGLGLAISKKIAKEHGGELLIKRLSQGSRFTLSLPVKT